MFNYHSLIPWGSFRGRQEEKWGSFRGRFGDHFRVGDHFGVGIISGAVQYPLLSYVIRRKVISKEYCMHYTPSHTNVCKFFNFHLTCSQLILQLKC